MTEMLLFFFTGLTLGIAHAFDTDHLAAVSTMGTLKKTGMLWGLGHAVTIFVVGVVVLIFHLNIPSGFEYFFETMAGAMLVILGAQALWKARQNQIHVHSHTHDGSTHTHFHSHKDLPSHEHSHLYRPFLLGLLHGLAGSAALMLLVLASADAVWQGIVFILVFGLGSILGMTAVSVAMSIPARFFGRVGHKYYHSAVGIISLVIGFLIILQ